MYGYREFLNRFSELYSFLRDRALEAYALVVRARKPISENVTDEYGDPRVSYGPFEEVSLVPVYEDQIVVVSRTKVLFESDSPIEAFVVTTENFPVRTLIEMPSAYIANPPPGESVVWYEVISSVADRLEMIHGHRIRIVPYRGELPP